MERLVTNPAPNRPLIKSVFKEFPENLVFGILCRGFPNRAKASNKPCNPISSLHRLIAVTFNLEWWLNQAAPRLSGVIHRDSRFSNQGSSLVVLIECQNEIFIWITIFFTMLVEAFDRLSKHIAVELVRVMLFRGMGFCTAYMK